MASTPACPPGATGTKRFVTGAASTPATRTATAFARCTSTPSKASGPCCAPGCGRTAVFRRTSCRFTSASSSSCTMHAVAAKPSSARSLPPWSHDSPDQHPGSQQEPPGEVISHAVWLYFRFPLSLRMVEEMLAARGIVVSHETVRQWARKFGQGFANQIRRRLPCPGDKWHLDEVCLMIRGTKHWLWRAVDQDGFVLDVLVQRRRDKRAAKRLLRKLLKKQMRPPRVMITDKLASYGVAKREVMPSVEH